MSAPTMRSHSGPGRAWFAAASDARSGLLTLDGEAGPLVADDARDLPRAPLARAASLWRTIDFARNETDLMFADAARLGDVVAYDLVGGPGAIVTISDPGHIRSIVTAAPEIAPSATRHSLLRPIVGGDSVLTTLGEQHRRQRARLMPAFHRSAVADCRGHIERACGERIDRWRPGSEVAVAGIAEEITLDVITRVAFGLTDDASSTPAERALRVAVRRSMRFSTTRIGVAAQLRNARREEATGILALGLAPLDRAVHRLIAERRSLDDSGHGDTDRDDVLSVLLTARTPDGARLSDSEIRDELVGLLLAGHETTAHTTAWVFERLTRHPRMLADARDAARAGERDVVDAVITETMRCRPVVPSIAREVLRPWKFGRFRVDAGTVVIASTILLHHRDDLYPQPFAFRPERFLGTRPSPHAFLPFGGGNRRCLGAHLAMAELDIIVTEVLRRVDLEATDRAPERTRHRNVTMIPADGGRVRARAVH